MKRKIAFVLSVILSVAGIIGLTACAEKHEHNYTQEVTEPTCTVQGYTTYTCECGETYTDSKTPALGHKKSAQYYVDGTYHWYVCTVCSAEVDKKTHTWDEGVATVPAAVGVTGVKTYTCTACDKKKAEEIPALPHTHKVTGAWLSDGAYHWRECANCSDEVNKEEHDWDEGIVTRPSTTTSKGECTFTCLTCDKTKTEEIPEIPHMHDFSENWEKNTAYHWRECSICGEEINKTEHDWNNGTVTQPATMTKTGIKTYTCTVCKQTKQEEIPLIPHEHDFSGNWKKDDAEHWKECLICSAEQGRAEHIWDGEVIINQPTTTSTGRKQFSCTECGHVKTEEIPALPAPNQPVYALTIEKTAYIVTGFDGSLEEITIPNTYAGLRVVAIGGKAFYKNTNVKKITLPDTILQIGSQAFKGCNNLKQINIPESVVEIEEEAFQGCISLSKLTFAVTIGGVVPGSLTIGQGAFMDCVGLTTLSLASNTSEIGASAFENCYTLKSITLNNSLEEIGVSAFANCIAIEEISLPMSLQKIGEFAFDSCTALKSIELPPSLRTLEKGAFRGAEALSSVILSPNLSAINDITFQSAKSLTQIVIPESVSQIGESAFSGCEALKLVKIMGDISIFKSAAFYRCENLEEIYYNSSVMTELKNEHYEHYNYIFYGAGIKGTGIKLTIGKNGHIPNGLFEPIHNSDIPKITSVVIEDGATTIDYFTSNYLPYVTDLTVPDSITDFGKMTFGNCESLIRINVAEGSTVYKTVDGNLYSADGTRLIRYAMGKKDKTFIIPSDVEVIDAYALFNCGNLEEITIPASVTAIDEGAFYACNGITEITIPENVATIGASAFGNCEELEKVIWNATDYTGNNYISSIFTNCSKLTNISFGENITTIKEGFLRNCNNLTSLTIPFVGGSSAVDSYEPSYSNYSDSQLFGYIFGSTMESNSDNGTNLVYQGQAYSSNSYNRGYCKYYIPDSLTSVTITNAAGISAYAFYGCTHITQITLNEGITDIYQYAFNNCTSLTNITIPDSVTTISSSAFSGCDNIVEAILPSSSISAIPKGNLKTIIITDGAIPSGAFQGCSSLTGVTIGNGVTTIGESAFSGCSSLSSVTISDSVTIIGSSVFSGCNKLTGIVIPKSVTTIGGSAFNGCSGLMSVKLKNGQSTKTLEAAIQ